MLSALAEGVVALLLYQHLSVQFVSLPEELLADTWSLSCGSYTTEVDLLSPGALQVVVS